MSFMAKRRKLSAAKDLLRHAAHVRNVREDLMKQSDLLKLRDLELSLMSALKSGNLETIDSAAGGLEQHIMEVVPPSRGSSLIENFEIIVVAIAVAMAVRTYFLQPFKIPTGSMQPTLYGIHYKPMTKPGITDRIPLKYAKWILLGEWYTEIKAKGSGIVTRGPPVEAEPSVIIFIGGYPHKVPRDVELRCKPGDNVNRGDIIWSGIKVAGDHLFVDKVRWNFVKPRRGDIMVFDTEGISGLPQGTHYIKRLSGLPEEELSIEPPNLVINGNLVSEPETIARIAAMGRARNGETYSGYQLAGSYDGVLTSSANKFKLGKGKYFALGDNTFNSRDSRYWGEVPRANLVGPAAFVYWPYSDNWGKTD